MNIERVALAGELREFRTVHFALIGFVDEFGVGIHPLADFGQNFD